TSLSLSAAIGTRRTPLSSFGGACLRALDVGEGVASVTRTSLAGATWKVTSLPSATRRTSLSLPGLGGGDFGPDLGPDFGPDFGPASRLLLPPLTLRLPLGVSEMISWPISTW